MFVPQVEQAVASISLLKYVSTKEGKKLNPFKERDNNPADFSFEENSPERKETQEDVSDD